MTTIYLDIETAPHDAAPGAEIPRRAWAATELPPLPLPQRGKIPSNLRDPAKIAARDEELDAAFVRAWVEHADAELAAHDAHRARALAWWGAESLDPIGRSPQVGGRIVCAAWAIDSDPPEIAIGDEPAILDRIAELVSRRDANGVIVGHNIRGFDAPFLASRALRYADVTACYRAFRPVDRWGPGRWVVDTLDLLPVISYAGRRTGTARLSDWARSLEISTGDQPGSGADVLGWLLAGDTDSIYRHCLEDVRDVRTLHRRLTLERP